MNFPLIIVLFYFLVSCSHGQQQKEEEKVIEQKPNFLFVLVDDLGWTDLGVYGSSFYETPNLDKIARKGMIFTNAYAACPVCSPTRASILSGKYPARIAATDWFGAPQPDEVEKHWTKNKPLLPASYNEFMALEEKTIAETLKENGYSTFFAGKWHLGETEELWPVHQGFDVNMGGYSSGSPRGNHYFPPYSNPRLEDGPETEHLPDRLASETINFIENNKDKPFLTYLSFYSVHTPLGTREDLKKKYEKKKADLGLSDKWGEEGERKVREVQCHPVYAGMVEAMDLAVGKVLNKLAELQLDKNTIVIFMSDNGGLSTSEGHPTSNLPLRGGKGWLYEGGIREPMFVFWPGVTPENSSCDLPVVSTDFYPTMLEMAGIPQLPQQHLDGKSIVPLLKNEAMERGAIFWHYPHYGNQGGSPGSAIREGDWKLVEWFEDGGKLELYNLKNDIGEKENLKDNNPEKLEELYAKLKSWRETVGARYPSPNPVVVNNN